MPAAAVVVVVTVDGPQQVLDQPAQDPEVVAAGRAEWFLAGSSSTMGGWLTNSHLG